ncbi:hypothetical protein [Oceanimonas doudoroffii]|uniref:hypothetical protein n=1 Tax=Oceanimonas doudoroffii TaxID=84158 RepID=UPI00114067FB|nr:hypothetical protein [Oceanimonas doudoroffii]
MPSVGDHLGDLTDELCDYGEGCFISEFVSGGPKQYSFRVTDPSSGKVVKTITKVKGFSLNYANAAHINFKRMRQQVKDFVKTRNLDRVTVYENQIQRMKNHNVVTVPTSKVQKVVYCKRVALPDFTTRPYGY